MMKKIVAILVFILLVLCGAFFLFWYTNKDAVPEDIVTEPTTAETVEVTKNEPVEETKAEGGIVKVEPVKKSVPNKVVIQNRQSEPAESTQEPETIQEEASQIFTESLLETKELGDPYVDDDGSIVVKNEFKPHLKENIFFRGVVYNIKTKWTNYIEE